MIPIQTRRIPAARIDLLGLIAALPDEVAYAYHRVPGGEEVLGIGRAFEFTRGPDGGRLAPALRRARKELGVPEGFRTRGPVALRLFTGIAFEAGRHREARSADGPDASRDAGPWERFPRLSLHLARHLFVREDDHYNVMTVGRHDASDCPGIDKLLALARHPTPRAGRSRQLNLQLNALDEGMYMEGVDRARRICRDDDVLQKAVIARRLKVEANDTISAGSVLRRLGELYPACRLFAVTPGKREGAPVFVGATPERLIEVRGTEAHTMALAGSMPKDSGRDNSLPDRLDLGNRKNLDEHAYVRRMIVDTLGDLGAAVRSPDEPEILDLPNVLHLQTPIDADLPDGLGAARVIDALHPTPAVCGTPTDTAAELIRQVEPFDRGLYAGVLGWMDLDGGGDFSVALRCGVIEGRTAHIFAGGGITADSDPDEELRESQSKFEPMLQAIREAHA